MGAGALLRDHLGRRRSAKFLPLHGGGEDLCFPHHENEIAQSEAATGNPFSAHWVHSVHLLVEGKKMSKSLGNFFVISDLLEKGYYPPEIRLAMLGGHYRQQFNFTLSGLDAAKSGLTKLENAVEALLESAGLNNSDWNTFIHPVAPKDWGIFKNAWAAFRNDLNTPAVLGALFNGLKKARKNAASEQEAMDALSAAGALIYGLGLDLFARPGADLTQTEAPADVQELAEARWSARKERDFAKADQLRNALFEKGWLVVDRQDGYSLQPKT